MTPDHRVIRGPHLRTHEDPEAPREERCRLPGEVDLELRDFEEATLGWDPEIGRWFLMELRIVEEDRA